MLRARKVKTALDERFFLFGSPLYLCATLYGQSTGKLEFNSFLHAASYIPRRENDVTGIGAASLKMTHTAIRLQAQPALNHH
jgi:hypothetical protein